jgi:hypothetical protein
MAYKPRTIALGAGFVPVPDVIQLDGALSSMAPPNENILEFASGSGTETLFTLLTGGDIEGTSNTQPNKAGVLKYKWLYNPDTGEIRQIMGILNDTMLQIESAFAVAMGLTDFYVFDHYAPKEVRINCVSGVQIYWPGQTVASVIADNTVIERKNIRGIDPLTVIAGDGTVDIVDP